MNDNVSYSELRKNLKTYLDKVCAEREPLLVSRKGMEDVVIISRAEYESLDETVYLLQSPANAKHLKAALKTPQNKYIAYSSLEDLSKELGLEH